MIVIMIGIGRIEMTCRSVMSPLPHIFAHHYVMPQCTPTRVAVFTGRYPGRFGRTPLQAANEPAFPKGTPTPRLTNAERLSTSPPPSTRRTPPAGATRTRSSGSTTRMGRSSASPIPRSVSCLPPSITSTTPSARWCGPWTNPVGGPTRLSCSLPGRAPRKTRPLLDLAPRHQPPGAAVRALENRQLRHRGAEDARGLAALQP